MKENRIKRGLSWKKLLLCATAALVLSVAVIYVCLGLKSDGSQSVRLEYRLIFENVDAELADKIKVGDSVIHSSSQLPLGKVTSVDSSEKYSVYEYDGGDSIVEREYPDRYNVRVLVSSDAEYEAGVGCNINGVRVAVGTGLELRFPSFVGAAYCTDVEWEENDE